MKEHFIFTSHDKSNINCFYDFYPEAGNEDIITFIPTFKQGNSIIRRASLSARYNRYIPCWIKYRYYNLESIDYKDDDIYHILIHTLTITKVDMRCIQSFARKHKNVRLYALLNDSMDANSIHMVFVREKLLSPVWTRVLTYDKYDAEKYGFTWIGYRIYSLWDKVESDEKASDCYYIGYNKGNRESLVQSVYNRMKGSGINSRFDIVSDTQNPNQEPQYLKNGIPYRDVVSRVKSTNCIIEILQNNQKSQSLRWFEAIAYNKKLLTNNANVRDLPYYDERYMKYFKKAEDIDLGWVSKVERIDYGYHNEFSPLELIRFIKDQVN